MKFNSEMIERAKTASTAEDLVKKAADEGIELSLEDAEKYFEFMHSDGSLSDEELDGVAGGKGNEAKYQVGQRVEYWDSNGILFHGKIESAFYVDHQKAWYYWCVFEDGSRLKFPLESPVCGCHVVS